MNFRGNRGERKGQPVNDQLIPTGVIESAKDSPMDLSVPKFIGSEIDRVESGTTTIARSTARVKT